MRCFQLLIVSAIALGLMFVAGGMARAQGNQRMQSQRQMFVPPQNQAQQQQQLQKQQSTAPAKPRPEDILRMLVPPPGAGSQAEQSYRDDNEFMRQADSTPSRPPAPTREEAARMSNEQLQRAVRRALATLDEELDAVQTGDDWRKHLELDAIACASWQQPAMPIDAAMRDRMKKIARKHDEVAKQSKYASVSQLSGFRALQATMPEYALGPVARSQRELKAELAALEQSLDRWSSAAQWKKHLQTEELRRLASGGDLQPADAERLRALLKSYDEIAKNQQYAAVAGLPQFEPARRRLQQLVKYADMLAIPVASTQLNPQPEPPGRSGAGTVQLNPQPEPPSRSTTEKLKGLFPQPETSSRSGSGTVQLNPQPEPPSQSATEKLKGLFPQPETPSRGLNPQPEPPGKPTGLNPQPEPPG